MISNSTIPGEYWGAISRNRNDFIFPSPVNIPDWLDEAANWLSEGETILEIGPGKADLASKVLSNRRKTRSYFIADISKDILRFARERLEPQRDQIKISYVQADLNDKDSLREIVPGSLNRVIMVNVFGYLDPQISLNKIHKILCHQGALRLTVGDYEFFSESEDYNPGIKCQYVRGRRAHIDAGIKPLGYTTSDDGEQIPFYGYRRGYSKEEIETVLEKNGFKIEQFKNVIIPGELWHRVRSYQSKKLNQKEQELLEKWGGRPTWDIIARRNK